MGESVSVVITTYKGNYKLKRALDSVLQQKYDNFDVIVVDDNDKDSKEREFTENLMKEYSEYANVCYIKHAQNKNGAVARNTGIKYAKGKYISFLDDDDFFLPERIKTCVEILEEKKEYIAVYTDSVLVSRDKVVTRNTAINNPSCKDILLNQNILGTGSNLFLLKSSVDIIQGFNTRFLRYQDVEFIMRILKTGKMAACNKVTVAKDIEDVRFMPAYKKLYQMQLLFENVFREEIDGLNNVEKWQFYSVKMSDLFSAAYASKSFANVMQARQHLTNVYKRMPIFECKKAIKGYLWCISPRIYRMLFDNARKYSKAVLSDEEQKILYMMLK